MTRALVMGGARGLGAAAADRLRGDGIEVVRTDIAGDCDVVLDVTDDQAIAEAASRIGAVDIPGNTAGIVGPDAPLLSTTSSSVGKEPAMTGVLVNAIAPAVIATPMNDDTAPEVPAHITSLIPILRRGGLRPQRRTRHLLSAATTIRAAVRPWRRSPRRPMRTGRLRCPLPPRPDGCA
ncbi:hypothetical protein ACBJ59_54100 [Nonomuraea sp. MTCD27]|uniref:hypothetical protein n=1 Tax=Nonomuraea sp. MTCD27 TaxID=1676747 RepID=UPI0035C07216